MRQDFDFEAEPFEIYPELGDYEIADAELTAENDKAVRWVQQALNQVMNLRLPVDGIMGPVTRSAIRTFQRRERLPIDGIGGVETKQALIADRNTIVRSASERALRDEVEPFEYEFGIKRTGSDYIRWVQRSLNRLLGLNLSENGSASSSLDAAVRSFQSWAGLSTDGKVGPATEHAMVEAGADPPPASGKAALVQSVLPRAGAGFYSYRLPHRSYGRFETIFNLVHIGLLWQLRHPNGPRIGFGELSLRGGGDISGHASHEKGVDVDIRPMRKDGLEEGVTWKQTAYSRELTQELIDLIRDNGIQRVQHIFFNDPKARRVQPWKNHDDHLHVRFYLPSSASSRELAEIGSRQDEANSIPDIGRTWGRVKSQPDLGVRPIQEKRDSQLQEEIDPETPGHVQWLQRSLNHILGLRLPEDGLLGPSTRSALRSFQSRRGLEASGVLNLRTERSLMAAGATPHRHPRRRSEGQALEFDPALGTSERRHRPGCQCSNCKS